MDLLNYSDELKIAIQITQAIARENANEKFSPAHLLRALLHKDFEVRELLVNLNKDVFFFEEWADARISLSQKSSKLPETVTADNASISVLNEADNIRLKISDEKITPLCVFIALSTPGVGFSYEQLKTFPVTPSELLDSLVAKDTLLKTVGKGGAESKSFAVKNTALLKYTIDKIQLARAGQLEKIVGREKEIRMIAEVLGRRINSNVMIIGDPGVGKSSVINGFCQIVADKKSSSWLNELPIFEISFGNLLAGASYKGEVEDRLQNIFNEVKSFENAVLIIENLHELLDKYGSAPGAVNVIKQELNKGEITLLATSTIDNFTKTIEKDNSLKGYFEIIKLEEANDGEILEILKSIIPEYYSVHHGLDISEEVMKESIRLSRRYLKERSLPSAAIDLIDRTMAVVRTAMDFTGPILAEVESEMMDLKNDDPLYVPKIQALLRRLVTKINTVIHVQLAEEILPDKFSEPAGCYDYLTNTLSGLSDIVKKEKKSLEMNDIAAVVSQKTNIPAGKLQSGEKDKLLHADEYLKKRVIGQDHAVSIINEAIIESRSGLGKAGQPIGSFFFLGPTGTGKTELAKTLAEFLFNDESSMIRFDMSEFKEQHSAALLYGAPPGYVGYEEGGLLVNKIRQKPYSVVLFDEIEKAHPSVFDVFLQITGEGKLHDRLGKEGDFSNSIIIFTSNIGSNHIVEAYKKNTIPSSNELKEIMREFFRPEFLGRLNEIIPFSPITEEMAERIFELHLKGLLKTLDGMGIELIIDPKAKKNLAKNGFSPQYGARPILDLISNQIRRPLSKFVIGEKISKGSRVELKLEKGEYTWSFSYPEKVKAE